VCGDAATQKAATGGLEPPDVGPASAVRAAAAAGCADLLRRGDLLGGKYEIRSKIGEGGMGQVYEALDRSLARRVAIKVARTATTMSLAQEARALAALRHPSIVSVFALEEHQGIAYVVMELLFGRTLEAVLNEHRARGTAIPIDEALDCLAAIADGLAAVHRGGMAHRDVKPANVMLSPGSRVVLTDFGIFQPEAWRSACFAGSPHYIAPEIVQGRVGMGELYLVDVYALGVVAYEMLTGRVPFDDPNVYKILVKHTSDPAPDPSDQREGVPERLAALVLEMLAKDPKARPQSMDEIAWQLRRLRTPQPAAPPSWPPARTRLPIRWRV
jgi:serine/threonine-protein kinase